MNTKKSVLQAMVLMALATTGAKAAAAAGDDAADAAVGNEAPAVSLADIVHLDYSVQGDKVVIVGHKGESRGTYEDKDIVATLSLDVASFPEQYLTAGGAAKGLKAYGICGLLQDRTSQEKGAAAKFKGMFAEANRLRTEGALWSETKERAERTPKAPKIDSFVAQAVAELKGASLVVVTAYLEKLDKDQLAKIAADANVVAKVAQLRAQVESSDFNLDDLFTA